MGHILSISTEPEEIHLIPEEKECTECTRDLTVRNTRTRTIVTNVGERKVTEVTLHCPDHKEIVSRPEKRLTPPKSPYGFDVIAEIGKLRYLEHKQISEIHGSFRNKGIHIPERTIENLCMRFLIYMVAVHIESFPQLDDLIKGQGGYILHVDATTTKGSPEILLLKDAVSGIRLLAASIPTEASDYVKPHLKTLREHFGNPIAAVRDMGKGFEEAIIEAFPGIYVITCHYHFLRNIGYRLFNKIYYRFQKRVDRTGIKKKLRSLRKNLVKRKKSEECDEALRLLDYIMEYKKDGNGLGYPFSLPAMDFYRRCEEVRPKVRKTILGRARNNTSSPCLSRLENALKLIKPPPAVRGRIQAEYLVLKERWGWFEKIRKALRYRNGPVPLNTAGFLSDRELEKGRKNLDEVQEEIKDFIKHGKAGKDRSLKKVLHGISDLITKRRDELLVPNVTVEVNGVRKVISLQRTNNTVEREFRQLRRHGRRIRGDSDVERLVQREGVGFAIVRNLEIKQYVRTVFGDFHHIAIRFSEVSKESLEEAKSLFLSL